MEEAWLVTEALLEEIVNQGKLRGVDVALLPLPTGSQVSPDPNRRRELSRRYQIDDVDYADTRISRIAERIGVRSFQFAEELRDYAVENEVFLTGFENTPPGFGHYNAEGHRLISELLARGLCDLLGGGVDGGEESDESGPLAPLQQ